jgi:hypothetical protein
VAEQARRVIHLADGRVVSDEAQAPLVANPSAVAAGTRSASGAQGEQA